MLNLPFAADPSWRWAAIALNSGNGMTVDCKERENVTKN